MNVDEYLDALASEAPTPGGGSAAALVAANGAALIAMVARITLRSQRHAPVHAQATIFAERAESLRQALRNSGIADEKAYMALRDVLRLPKSTEEERLVRNAQREIALAQAAEAPLLIAQQASDVAILSEATLALGNTLLESDLLCAVEFALAATNAAAANVLINHRSMTNENAITTQRERLWKACQSADHACATLRTSFAKLAAM